MLDALRNRLAWRAARRAVRDRRRAAPSARLRDRRLLLVLPSGSEEQRDAWGFVRALELDPGHVLALSLGGPLAHVPDAFAGNARVFGPEALDWRGLPRPVVTAEAWGWRPDVAVDFSRPFRLSAAYLAGGSPAWMRVGLYDDAAELFFDLLYAPGEGAPGAGLRRYLSALDPPVLPFRPRGWL